MMLKQFSISWVLTAVIIVFINSSCYSQLDYKIDSIKNVIEHSENDMGKVNSIFFLLNIKPDNRSTIYYAYLEEALEISSLLSYNYGMALSYFHFGEYYYVNENYFDAIKNYQRALIIFRQDVHKYQEAWVLMKIGLCYLKQSDILRSNELFYESMGIAKSLNENEVIEENLFSPGISADKLNELIGENLFNLGTTNRMLRNFDKAIVYYKQTLEIDLKLGVVDFLVSDYYNLGEAYFKLGDSIETSNYLHKAVQLESQINNEEYKTKLTFFKGKTYLELNKLDSAFIYLNEAYNRILRSKVSSDIIEVHLFLGKYYLAVNNYDKAIYHQNMGINLSKVSNYLFHITELYQNLSTAYNNKKQYKKAYQSSQRSAHLLDSLNLAVINKSFILDKQQIELEKAKNDFLIEQNIKQIEIEKGSLKLKLVTRFSIIIITFFIVILLIVVINYRNKSKINKRLKEKGEIIELQSDELKSTINNLEVNEEKLRNLNATKDRFFSIISHDLKNPFNILLGYADLLVNEPSIKKDSKKLDKIINTIRNTTKFSYELLENLLTWSQSQTGGLKVNPTLFNLSQSINSKIEFFEGAANSKEITMNFDVHDNLHVFADQNMILTTVRNLISNAIKFTMRGGNIELTAKQLENNIIFSVKDDGIGISSEDQEKLFRIDSDFKINGTDNEKGTGLGLILCKDFIIQNGGEISVESEKGKGSIFTFTLPIAKTDE